MHNYKLTIQYDGTDYAGWQIQDNAQSVQGTITDKIKTITGQDVNLIGSGRTDAGVHALGQVANFKNEDELNLFRFKHSLNSLLPNDISITEIKKVNESFNSRFDAKKRSYIYLISKSKSPFYYRYSYFYKADINIEKLNRLADLFTGEKDFTSFCKKQSDVKNKICCVYEARWYKKGELIYFLISANRFLHGMVRAVIGTLLKAQEENSGSNYIDTIFRKREREAAAEAVPAKGLFLYKVVY